VSLEKVKKGNNKTLSENDVVLAVLINMLGEDDRMIHNTIYLHLAFHKLKKDPKYEGKYERFLEDFTFDESGISPFSQNLEQVVFRLGMEKKMNILCPWFNKYTISGKRRILEKIYKKIPHKDIKLIEEMAREAKSIILKGA